MNIEHLSTETLIDYLHRELDVASDAAVHVHLTQCASCARDYDVQARLSEALRAYGRESERELPQGVVNVIWDRIERESERPGLLARLAALWRPAVALPAAAVIVVAAFFGYTATHREATTTTIDASYYLQDHAALTDTVPFSEGGGVPESLRSGAATTQVSDRASGGAAVVADAR